MGLFLQSEKVVENLVASVVEQIELLPRKVTNPYAEEPGPGGIAIAFSVFLEDADTSAISRGMDDSYVLDMSYVIDLDDFSAMQVGLGKEISLTFGSLAWGASIKYVHMKGGGLKGSAGQYSNLPFSSDQHHRRQLFWGPKRHRDPLPTRGVRRHNQQLHNDGQGLHPGLPRVPAPRHNAGHVKKLHPDKCHQKNHRWHGSQQGLF